jgi:superfamily I DNA and/or RNA helicase
VQAAEKKIEKLDQGEQKQRARLSIETPDGRRIKELTAQIQDDEQTIREGNAQLARAQEEVDGHQLRHVRVVARLSAIEEEERTLTARVLDGAQLIGATLTSLTTNPYLRTRTMDAVIIDEASMASMGMVVVAAAHARLHVNLVGDPLQLAPIVKVKNREVAPHALYWLGTDIFSHLGLTLDDADAGTNQVVLLSQQSRMVSEIAEPDSRYIYGGRLKNRPDPERKVLYVHPLPESPLLLVDTSDVDRGKHRGEPKICTTARPSRSSSKYNVYHVECVVKLVRLLTAQLPESQVPQIGIVTPYGAQKTRIRNALRARGLLRLVHVGTVHSFQSLEYPIMIFDTVEAPDVAVGRFISNVWGRNGIASDATRLINVAHSRARDKLIYIAHLDYINERHLSANQRQRRNHVLTQFVNYANVKGHLDSHDLG